MRLTSMCPMIQPSRNSPRRGMKMPRQPTPMQETELATAMHDLQIAKLELPEKMDKQTVLWIREQLKKKGIKFAERSPEKPAKS